MARAKNVPLAIVWAIISGPAGGYVCGLVIDRYGELGSLSLWAMAALGGYVGQRILVGKSRLVGWLLVVSSISSLIIAETCWIHWNIKQGTVSWLAAFKLLPAFVKEYEQAAVIAAIATALGAWSAYRQTAVGYRRFDS